MNSKFILDTPSEQNKDGGIEKFSEDLANSICNMYDGLQKDVGSFVISLEGEWGVGKSTILNMVSKKIDPSVSVVKFNPWNFSTSEDLIQKFFGELLSKIGNDKSYNKELFKKIKKYVEVLSFTSVIPQLSFMSKLADLGSVISKLTENESSLEDIKREVNNALENHKILVLIDDIDRLLPNQILQIFQLVKSTGDLNNIIYLLAFDKTAVCHHLSSAQIITPEKYLDKIIQVTLRVPNLPKRYIRDFIFKQLDDLGIQYRWVNGSNVTIFGSVLSFLMNDNAFGNMRAVKKYFNTLMFEYHLVKGLVDDDDFIAITYIKVFHYDTYTEILKNKAKLTKKTGNVDFSEIIKSDVNNELLRELIRGLFPIVKSGFIFEKYEKQYEEGKGIWSENNFHRYFNLRPSTLDDNFAQSILESESVEDLYNVFLKLEQDDLKLIELLGMKAEYINENDFANFLEFLLLNLNEIVNKNIVSEFMLYDDIKKLTKKIMKNNQLDANRFLINVLNDICENLNWIGNIQLLNLLKNIYITRDSKQGIENSVYNFIVGIVEKLYCEIMNQDDNVKNADLKVILEFILEGSTPKMTIEVIENILNKTINDYEKIGSLELQERLEILQKFIKEKPIIEQDSSIIKNIGILKGLIKDHEFVQQ
jgi:hypothetical protein